MTCTKLVWINFILQCGLIEVVGRHGRVCECCSNGCRSVWGAVQLMFSGGCVAERERVRVFAELDNLRLCAFGHSRMFLLFSFERRGHCGSHYPPWVPVINLWYHSQTSKLSQYLQLSSIHGSFATARWNVSYLTTGPNFQMQHWRWFVLHWP